MTGQSETALMVLYWVTLIAIILVTPTPPRNKGGRK